MKKILYTLLVVGMASFSACTDDLNQYPNIEETSESVYANPDNYISALAKCYASFVTAGQGKGGEDPDLSSNNGYDYMRCYFNMQEAGTDEIGSTWIEGDNIGNLTFLTWDAQDPWVADMYYRSYYSISLCNEFLKNSTDSKIAGFTEAQQTAIRTFRAEARFLRALAYFHAMDLFGSVPFADENLIGSAALPERWEAAEIFEFIETELIECSAEMTDADHTDYGRAPRAAAWMLLARMYLNAATYNAGDHYSECMTYSQKVMDEAICWSRNMPNYSTPTITSG
ncbi:RagB/SusD family nutrient uptake outer membrane protein [Geofilum rubicundum]|uniref:SusD, outer membrane protein n=1 Tax=Geofilum rubicundum JCM 15548 TaxID=1236989 RepID=A0A0E9LXC8_9BACT|nr:RagB/SusD family nutrient uptake outer membrane protein [Geofilum rubicundum]GAO30237.1 SusD, outer membrane protein [Geofilum rubicundum JCM 15548]